jgi:hypothetical protein
MGTSSLSGSRASSLSSLSSICELKQKISTLHGWYCVKKGYKELIVTIPEALLSGWKLEFFIALLLLVSEIFPNKNSPMRKMVRTIFGNIRDGGRSRFFCSAPKNVLLRS